MIKFLWWVQLFGNNIKNPVNLCFIATGVTAQHKDKKWYRLEKWYIKSGKLLGISNFNFSDIRLDSILQLEINKKLKKIIRKYGLYIIYATLQMILTRITKNIWINICNDKIFSEEHKPILYYGVPIR